MYSVVSNQLLFLSTATVLERFLVFWFSCPIQFFFTEVFYLAVFWTVFRIQWILVFFWPPGSGAMDPDPVNKDF